MNMKRIISVICIVATIFGMMSLNAFAEDTEKKTYKVKSLISPTGYGELDIDPIYCKVANRLYHEFQKGNKEVEIWLKGVEFDWGDGNTYASTILTTIGHIYRYLQVDKDGDIVKIKAKIGYVDVYLPSSEAEVELNKLITESKKHSNDVIEQLGYINDQIGLNCRYDWESKVSYTEHMGDTINSVLVYKDATCGGFANTVQEVCDRMGVKSIYVSNKSLNHAYNLVYLNNEWYLWDLSRTAIIKGEYGKEVIYYSEQKPDGSYEVIKGPGSRQYFLIPIDSPRGRELLQGSYYTDDLLYGYIALWTSIKYPELSTIDLSLDGIEVPVTKNEIVKPEEPAPVSPPAPAPSQTPIYGLDSQGNLIVIYSNDNKQAVKAFPTTSTVLVNGKKVSFEAYNIAGNNYFKLRDIAAALNGTNKQFEVIWDGKNNVIKIISNSKYTVVGGELVVSNNPTTKDAKSTTSKVYIDNKEVQLTAYNINGNNYFKLRDIGKALNFGVIWDGGNNTIKIDTSIGYTD